jgi:hypothetical protein
MADPYSQEKRDDFVLWYVLIHRNSIKHRAHRLSCQVIVGVPVSSTLWLAIDTY